MNKGVGRYSRSIWMASVTAIFGVSAVGIFFFVQAVSTNRYTVEIEESIGAFRLRATRRISGFQYRYDFQVRNFDQVDWHTVHSHVQDDPNPISDRQVEILNKDIAFFWMGSVFGVTRDAGSNWIFFDVQDHSGFGSEKNVAWIRDAALTQDGIGRITLFRYDRRNPPVFLTSDFGANWTEVLAE